jgi:hypothetical protein
MTSQLIIVEKTSLLDKTIHITHGCTMHLHGHWNKVVPLMKPFIFTNFNNGVKFCNCTCSLVHNIHSHCLSC